jgi:hypothetical protein
MERFFELPVILQVLIAGMALMFYCIPAFILRAIERIHSQNERIISLLVDIKRGDREI